MDLVCFRRVRAPEPPVDATHDVQAFLRELGDWTKRIRRGAETGEFIEWFKLNEVRLSALFDMNQQPDQWAPLLEAILASVCELLKVLLQRGGGSTHITMNNIHLYRVVASLVGQLVIHDKSCIPADQLVGFRALVNMLKDEKHPEWVAYETIITSGDVLGVSPFGDLAAVVKDMTALMTTRPSVEGLFTGTGVAEAQRSAATHSVLVQRLKYLLMAGFMSHGHAGSEGDAAELEQLVKEIHDVVCPSGENAEWEVLPVSLWAGTLSELLTFSRVVSSKATNKEGECRLVLHNNCVLYQRIPMLGERGAIQFPVNVKKVVVGCLVCLLRHGRLTPGALTELLRKSETTDNKKAVGALLKTVGDEKAQVVRHRAVFTSCKVIESGFLGSGLSDWITCEVLDTVRSDVEAQSLVEQMETFEHTKYYLNITLKERYISYKVDNVHLLKEVTKHPDQLGILQAIAERYECSLAVLAAMARPRPRASSSIRGKGASRNTRHNVIPHEVGK
eukprot:TRINITY_DN1422_c1_g1_i5.p1 TRINITY_DN1422_c1_g1~~TRINITY_DN1422_c1_g1_i5.p1  ORF type:complete len:505 (+),score=103.73 TRINITY_DN1422_c1_g1_i5:45-1559(+)